MKMRILSLFLCIFIMAKTAGASEVSSEASGLAAAMTDARASCIGISDNIRKLQTMAGVNTAVSGVGTIAAGGALYVGIQKSRADKLADKLGEELEKFIASPNSLSDEEFMDILGTMAELKTEEERQASIEEAKAAAEKKSKTLGHWRTGLMIGSTAANVGGAIISNKNKNDGGEISTMVSGCMESINRLRLASSRALADGTEDIGALAAVRTIIDACGKWSMKDLEKIPKWQNVAQWSSIVGIGTGASGTVTSFIANTDKIRNDNSSAGQKTENNLNLASNILAGATMVAGGVATGFNIATITSINKILKTAEHCEKALN